MADVEIRSTITCNSMQRLFGPPGAINYKAHPNQRGPENPELIFNAMKQKEVTPVADIKVLKGTVYSFKNRKIITRWIRDVCAAFSLRATTLCLAVQLTDAYILSHLGQLQVSQCQLTAVACTWIAAKFEEMDEALPSAKALVEVCDHAYTREQIIDMEEDVLESFKWRLPHSTVINFVYLMLHMHSHPAVAKQILELRAAEVSAEASAQVPANASRDDVFVQIVIADAERKARSFANVTIPITQPLTAAMPALCAAARMQYNPAVPVDVLELAGNDFYLARRINASYTPGQLGMRGGNPHAPVKLYLANSGAVLGLADAATSQKEAQKKSGADAADARPRGAATVFAESDDIIILRTVNALMLHIADVLAAEVITHVEFLRLPSHVIALGVIALARCLCGKVPTEARALVLFIVKTLGTSASQSLAAAELLAEKYREASTAVPEPAVPTPIVAVPQDINERLKFVFGK